MRCDRPLRERDVVAEAIRPGRHMVDAAVGGLSKQCYKSGLACSTNSLTDRGVDLAPAGDKLLEDLIRAETERLPCGDDVRGQLVGCLHQFISVLHPGWGGL